ncbi:MAG: hypothetical protein R8G66_15755 [Cytophagales bacterium]|nr:hypothetical protein [Cytophagales bacterium]
MSVIKIYFWMTMVITVIASILNVGLLMIIIAIVVIPLIVSQIKIGLNLEYLHSQRLMLLFSSTNFLIFSLIRPDGVHGFNQTGFTALVVFFGYSNTFPIEMIDEVLLISCISLFVQIILNVVILRKLRVLKNEDSMISG